MPRHCVASGPPPSPRNVPGPAEADGRWWGVMKADVRAADNDPVPVMTKTPPQHQQRRKHRRVGDAAGHIMHLVVPRLASEPRAGQQHVITPEHSRRDGRGPRHHDQPRPRRPPAPAHPAKRGTEPGRAGTQDHKPGHHDPRVPGIVGGQATELHPGRRYTGLAQRANHPPGGEQHRARDAAQSRQLPELHRRPSPPGPLRLRAFPRRRPVLSSSSRWYLGAGRMTGCLWPRPFAGSAVLVLQG
jgi:hypothetical protein